MAGKKKSVSGKSRPTSSSSFGAGKFTCATCGYVTYIKARYTKHVKYHSMPFIKCEFCDFESQYSWNLERHMKNHNNSDGKRMQCPLCNFACDMKQSLTSHVQNHHKDVPEEILSQFRTSCASSPRKSPNPGSRRQSSEYFAEDVDSYENDEEEKTTDQMFGDEVVLVTHSPTPARKKIKILGDNSIIDGKDRSLFTKKFYKCRKCSFNALSELGLSRHVHQSHNNSSKTVKSASEGGGTRNSANTKFKTQMPLLHKKCPGLGASTVRDQAETCSVKATTITKTMPSLIPIPKSNCLTSSSSITHAKSDSSLSETSHQNHEKESNSKPIPSSYPHQIHSRHQDDSKIEEEDSNKKIRFLQSLGLTPTPLKSPSPEKSLSNFYNYNSHNNNPYISLKPRKIQLHRRTSFFEKLSKKLISNLLVGDNTEEDSHTLSQAPATTNSIMKIATATTPTNKSNSSGNSSSIISITSNSTRCQYCRHRNKTSHDLMNHLEQCQEAQRFLAEEEENEMEISGGNEPQIFVWNKSDSTEGGDGALGDDEELDEEEDEEINQENKTSEMEQEYFHNFEGFTNLTVDLENYEKQMSSPARNGNISRGTDVVSPKSGENSVTKSRKVYKCPQKDCDFWATTASRFHVHIVAHYNTKPFECSQCSYRSNWRWDITKHIKLKTMRDPGHAKAKVLLTHKSGERNYRKYDRYLVPMSMTYSADSKLPDCSTVASKRCDVELDSSPSPSSHLHQQKPSPNTKTSSTSPSTASFVSMPKLIKAPHSSVVDGSYANLRQALNSSSESTKSSSSMSTPPPPPTLTPIITISPVVPSPTSKNSSGRSFVEKRMLAGGEILQNMESLGREITVTPINSSSNNLQIPGQNKSTTVIWKCKKCSFRNSNKSQVIAHINQVHKPKIGESMSILSRNNLVEVGRHSSAINSMQVVANSNKQEIFKHWENSQITHIKSEPVAIYNCDNCSFSTASAPEMNQHEEMCRENETEIYTCVYCCEEFPSQREGQEHVLLHSGVEDSLATGSGEEDNSWEVTVGSGTIGNELIHPEEICVKPPRGSAAQQSGLIFKKYHCQECPYITDSKGQFIYHKKFHIPSPNSPYKCGSCSYRVSHKHLLQQHVRVHTAQLEQIRENESLGRGTDELEILQQRMDQDQVFMSRPRLMIWKDSQPYSVVRCRFCPQVFLSGKDLTEHEDQHQRSENEAPSSQGRSQYQICEGSDDEVEDGVLNLSLKSGQSSKASPDSFSTDLTRRQGQTLLYICEQCPARFFYERELVIHLTFHERRNEFKCQLCSYSARQEVPHLMSHMKVHSTEYQDKTRSLLQTKFRVAPKVNSKRIHSPSSPIETQVTQRMPVLKRMTPVNPISISPSRGKPSTCSKEFVVSDASIPCRRCPARFDTLSGFISHSHRHGMKTGFQCKHCDFGADSHNNLTFHSLLHSGSEVTIEPQVLGGAGDLADFMKENGNDFIMPSETVQQIPTVVPGAEDVECQNQQRQDDCMDFSVAGAGAFQGNPEFKYQTYLKNGKVKSKRYKCYKCPSAFEKRDQYKVHMGLHGSDQRYKCTVCDYSVTYYANFIQHLKKHENQANVTKEQLIATPLSKMSKIVTTPASTTNTPSTNPQGRRQIQGKNLYDTAGKSKTKVVPPLVLKVPKAGGVAAFGKSSTKNHLACSKCPFKTDNASSMSEHEEGHGMSVTENVCPFCSFSSKDKESLKSHLIVHFDSDFTPVLEMTTKDNNGTPSHTDSSDSDDDYEAVVKKASKKKIMVDLKPGISVEYC